MKKTTIILLSVISLLLIYSSSSCNKDEDFTCIDCSDSDPDPNGPKDTVFLNKEFLKYWYAETGSWWVFKRTDTIGVDIYDTMRVIHHERKFFPNTFHKRLLYEHVLMVITHSNVVFKSENYINNWWGKYDAVCSSLPNNTDRLDYNWEGDKTNFKLPIDNVFRGLLNLNFPFTIHTYESRILPYKVMDNYFTIETPYGPVHNTLKISDIHSLNISFYISMDVGISRMELQTGQVWELVDCNVVKSQ